MARTCRLGKTLWAAGPAGGTRGGRLASRKAGGVATIPATEDLEAHLETRAASGELAAQLDLADRHDANGRPELATRWLGTAARQGSLVAIAQLGARTIVGAGCAARPADGKALLEFAASAGSGPALRHLAVLALSGFDGAADWRRAIELVGASANAGDTRAQAELDTLIGSDGAWSSAGMMRDAQARAAAMLAPPRLTPLSSRPLVVQLDAVISPALCAWLREWCAPALVPAGTIDRTSGEFRIEAARTNSFARIGLFDQPLELQLFKLRLAVLVGQPVENFEGTNLLAYEPGQEFAVHHDYLDPSEPGFAAELAERGQRVATVLVALNADYAGGETVFPGLDLAWRGNTGDALYFRNVKDDGKPDTHTLHAGRPPADGRKWLLSQWIRDRTQAPG